MIKSAARDSLRLWIFRAFIMLHVMAFGFVFHAQSPVDSLFKIRLTQADILCSDPKKGYQANKIYEELIVEIESTPDHDSLLFELHMRRDLLNVFIEWPIRLSRFEELKSQILINQMNPGGDLILRFFQKYIQHYTYYGNEDLTPEIFLELHRLAKSLVKDQHSPANDIYLDFHVAQAYLTLGNRVKHDSLIQHCLDLYEEKEVLNPKLFFALLDEEAQSLSYLQPGVGKVNKYYRLLALIKDHRADLNQVEMIRVCLNGARLSSLLEFDDIAIEFAREAYDLEHMPPIDTTTYGDMSRAMLAKSYLNLSQKDSALLYFNELKPVRPPQIKDDNIFFILNSIDRIDLLYGLGHDRLADEKFSKLYDFTIKHFSELSSTFQQNYFSSILFDCFQIALKHNRPFFLEKIQQELLLFDKSNDVFLLSYFTYSEYLKLLNDEEGLAEGIIIQADSLLASHHESTINNITFRTYLLKLYRRLHHESRSKSHLDKSINMSDSLHSYINKVIGQLNGYQIPIYIRALYGVVGEVLDLHFEFKSLDDETLYVYFENIKSFELYAESHDDTYWDKAYASRELIQSRERIKHKISQVDQVDSQESRAIRDSFLEVRSALRDSLEKFNLLHLNSVPFSDISPTKHSLSQIKKYLNANEVMAIFFQDEHYVYLLGITIDSSWVDRIPINRIDKQMKNMNYSLSDSNAFDIPVELNRFISKNLFLKSKNSLIVIPDGYMNKVNIETIKMSNGQMALNQYNVSYNPSAQLWLNLRRQKGVRQTSLFALSGNYSKSNDNSSNPVRPHRRSRYLPSLPYAEKEVKEISRIWNTESFHTAVDTKSEFLKRVGQYDIYHLAIHTHVHKIHSLSSQLIFGNQSNQTISLGEVSHMSLDAELITLSACASGDGLNRQAHGIKSLARGFLGAGSKCVIMSLWQVPDESTATIMINFYKHLADGASKDEALRQSKLDYLQYVEDPALAHPFYWAGFVVFGDTRPLMPIKNHRWSWIWLIGVSTLVIGMGIGRYLWFPSKA